MSEGGTLFNQGFLGAGSFHWWIGQVVDDAMWRDNIVPAKQPDEKSVKGWGYRYKVRIIGYHDQDPNISVRDEDLPWAQVMYPITAGGGQSGSSATPNIRQGMFVFGFFLDGPDGQNPVIIGVLGQNAQTGLKTSIGGGNKGYVPTSGYAKGTNPDPNIKAPDHDLRVNAPDNAPQSPPPVNPSVIGTSQRVATGEVPPSGPTLENTTMVHQTTNADVKRNDLYLRKTALSSPCKEENSDIKNIQTVLENLSNDINKIQQTANSYVDAVSNVIGGGCEGLVQAAAAQISSFMKSIYDRVRAYIIKLFNKSIAPTIDKLLPNQRTVIMILKEKGTQMLVMLYNKLIDQLLGLVTKFLSDTFCKKKPPKAKSPKPAAAAAAAAASAGAGTTTAPVTGDPFVDRRTPISLPGSSGTIYPEDYAPTVPMCTVDSLVGTILGTHINEMVGALDKAIDPINKELTKMIDEYNTLGAGIGEDSNLTGALSGLTNTVTASSSSVQDSVSSSSSANSIDKALTSANSALSQAQGFLNSGASLISGIMGSVSQALGFVNTIIGFFKGDSKPKCPVNDTHTLQNGGGSTSETPNNDTIQAAAEAADPLKSAADPPFATPASTTPTLVA